MASDPHLPASADGLQVESADTPPKPDDYVVVNGHRMVKPYHFDFCCSVRQRWLGQNIIDIFTREFLARDRQYYLQALADGRLRVEGMQATADTRLKEGQRMRHFIHRHEPPVPAGSIQVVGETADVVAVCKPHGMPVHVAGQYRKNTVLGILTAERPDLGQLFPIHRLDKPVSGLLLFARSAAAAAAMCQQIESRTVEKVYVARVLGRFPASDEPIVVAVPLAWDPVSNNATAEPQAAAEAAAAEAAAAEAAAVAGEAAAAAAAPAADDEAAALPQEPDAQQQQDAQAQQQDDQQQPEGGAASAGVQLAGSAAGVSSLQQQRRLHKQQQKQQKQQRKVAKAVRVAAAAGAAKAAAARPSKSAAKPSQTDFRLLAVAEDGRTSIVECRPRTGRTHQIRVHLQYLGYPIANDSQYGGPYGGPMASRQMAQQLGVHWGGEKGGSGGSGSGVATAAEGPAAEAACSDDGAGAGAAAAVGAAGAECSKRQRLEGPPSGAQPAAAVDRPEQAAPATAAACAPAAGSQHTLAAAAAAPAGPAAAAAALPSAGAAAAFGAGDAEACARNLAFRRQPEYEVPAALCDALCTHCPYFAPRDYPLDLRPLWLHARSYRCQEDGWGFATELPEWALADWRPPEADIPS